MKTLKNSVGRDVEVEDKSTYVKWSLFNSIPDDKLYRIPASRFKLRNVGYSSNKQKVPSKPGMYDVMGADIVRGKNGRVQHLVHNFVMDFPNDMYKGDVKWTKDWGIPEILICNAEIPIQTGGMFGMPADDHGFSFVTYFMLNQESRRTLASGQLSPQLKLWQRTIKLGRSVRKGCSFKFLAQCENVQEVPISPSSIKGYNGKPVLLCDT